MAAFDPYHKWLGIPPREQPPDHYRLLGIGRFEDDPQVIESAADRQMAHVRTYQAGPHSVTSQQLLNELAAARICLLNREKKAAYDRQLAARLAPAVTARPVASIPALAQPSLVPSQFVERPPVVDPAALFEPQPPPPWPGKFADNLAAGDRTPGTLGGEFSISMPLVTSSPGVSASKRRRDRMRQQSVLVGSIVVVVALAAVLALLWPRLHSAIVGQQDRATGSGSSRIGAGGRKGAIGSPAGQQGTRRQDARRQAEGLDSRAAKELRRPGDRPNTTANANRPADPSTAIGTISSANPRLAASPVVRLKTAPDRRPPPDAATVRKAQERLRELFGPQIASAKTPQAQFDLAKKLFEEAQSPGQEPPLRYVLLSEARDLASKLGDTVAACEAIDELGRTFESDTLAEKAEAMQRALKAARQPQQQQLAVLGCLVLLERSVTDERYDLARRFGAMAATTAHRLRPPGAVADYADKRLGDVRRLDGERRTMSAAEAKLRINPDDAEANLAVGKYRALVRGDWKAGLPLLATCSDPTLSTVSRLELADDPSQYVTLADAWWSGAEKEVGAVRAEYRLQAKYWYQRALASLADALKQRVERNIAQAPGYPLNRLRPGLLAIVYNGADMQERKLARIDRVVDFNFANSPPASGVPGDYFSIEWMGWLNPPLPGKYRLITHTDDSVRLWIDGELLIDVWNAGAAGRREAQIDLDARPHAIRLAYNDYIVTAMAELRWAYEGMEGDQIVPAWTLYHDPREAAALSAVDNRGDYSETLDVPLAPGNELLAIFEDQNELVPALVDGDGQATLSTDDVYAGRASVKVTPQQSFCHNLPGLSAAIREHPRPGEYRYLRFAWKKQGGERICFQLAHSDIWGPTADSPGAFRYDAGPGANNTYGAAINVGPTLPNEWIVVNRDLFADFGELTLTGISLAPFDGVHGLFDHIYLARGPDDFDLLYEP